MPRYMVLLLAVPQQDITIILSSMYTPWYALSRNMVGQAGCLQEKKIGYRPIPACV